jgi:hypothetical protein
MFSNKIIELIQQKKETTDQVISLLEDTDTFDTIINRELFEKGKPSLIDIKRVTRCL